MQTQAILSADYLDILFDNRNKIYGSYELRKNYTVRLQKALLCVLLISSVSFLTLQKNEATDITLKPFTTVTTIRTITPEILPEIPKPLPSNPPPTEQRTIKLTPPEIVKDHFANIEMPSQEELRASSPGFSTTAGDNISDIIPGNDLPGNSTEGTITTATSEKPLRYASQMPEFNGDLKTYLSTHLKYPALARENNIEGKVSIQFVIDEEGTITDATVIKGIGGGCDEEALRVIKMMPRWKPGKQNDKPVKMYLILPIIFQLD